MFSKYLTVRWHSPKPASVGIVTKLILTYSGLRSKIFNLSIRATKSSNKSTSLEVSPFLMKNPLRFSILAFIRKTFNKNVLRKSGAERAFKVWPVGAVSKTTTS